MTTTLKSTRKRACTGREGSKVHLSLSSDRHCHFRHYGISDLTLMLNYSQFEVLQMPWRGGVNQWSVLTALDLWSQICVHNQTRAAVVSVTGWEMGPQVRAWARSKAETISYDLVITFVYPRRRAHALQCVKVRWFNLEITREHQISFIRLVEW